MKPQEDTTSTSNASSVSTPAPAPISGLRPPQHFSIDGNIGQNWQLFKQKWNNYVIIANMSVQSEEYKKALFLHTIGDDALKIYNGFDLAEPHTTDDIIKEFDRYAIGERNETYERFLFNQRKQGTDETFESFLSAIRTLIKTCNYCGKCIDSILRDRIVLGVKEITTQQTLLKERNLSLQTCIDICKAAENALQQGKYLRPEETANVNQVRPKTIPRDNFKAKISECKFCGTKHQMKKSKCPAWGKTCAKCRGSNHYAIKCPDAKKPVNMVELDAEESDGNDACGNDIYEEDWINVANNDKSKDIKCRLLIGPNETSVIFQLDTGASANLIPKRYVPKAKLTPIKSALRTWDGTVVTPSGAIVLPVINPRNGNMYRVRFIVVNEELTPLLSYKTAESMNLLKVKEENFERVLSVSLESHASKYHEVFSDTLGKLPGVHTLRIDPSVAPKIMPTRRIPISLREPLKTELDRLSALGVLEPVAEPTPWISQLVIARKKNGAIRICIDPKELNKAILRERYVLPVLDDTLHELGQSRYFSQADLKSGYWHIELDKESSWLTTFQTCFGRYRWLRLPFGLSASSEIFQRELVQALDGLPGVICIADDVVIHGQTLEEHDKHLAEFLQRCQQVGIRLNKQKMKVAVQEITFMGHKISSEGLQSDPEKVKAIQNLSPPENIHELRRFLGMINFLGKFIPHLSDELQPLQNLLKADVMWNWSSNQNECFHKMKQLVTSTPTLQFYNPDKPLTIENDASEYGIGSAMYQEGKPIAFASRTLTPAERKYAQIEKEMLAIVYGLRKFHHFTYGRDVTVITDHKPLVAISNKPLSNAPKRLQNMLLKAHDYKFTLEYRPGHTIPVADTLSRAPMDCMEGEEEVTVNNLDMINVSDKRLDEIRNRTKSDPILCTLMNVIIRGWPESKEQVPVEIRNYFHIRDEMTAQNGIILRGSRIVIPSSMQREIKDKLHAGHFGINSCLRRARDLVYWPGMSSEIRTFIDLFHMCTSTRQAGTRAPNKFRNTYHSIDNSWHRPILCVREIISTSSRLHY